MIGLKLMRHPAEVPEQLSQSASTCSACKEAIKALAPHDAARRCSITKCGEDGVAAQDRSRVEMEACTVNACRGPALDLTLHAQATVSDSALTNCSGDA